MRHLYDLAKLREKIIIDGIFVETARRVYLADAADRMKIGMDFNAAADNALRVLSGDRKLYESDYDRFVTSMSYDENPVSYDRALNSFGSILSEITGRNS